MKGDFSKKTFDVKKKYKNVNMQMGRVLLDTDWNEQNDIANHRVETESIDTIGKSGAPIHAAGFEIIPVDSAGNPVTNATNGTGIKIAGGRFYVEGLLCENESEIAYNAQPDLPGAVLPLQPADEGNYLFYLDVWERHLTALEDAAIREIALNGADTTTRTKTVWQVKYKKMSGAVTCLTNLPADVLGPTDAQRGKINAKTEAGSSTGGPCGLVTSGGYKGLANQLYRVEIHKTGSRATATFKWSRENGSVISRWKGIDTTDQNKLILENPGRDDLLGFKSGDWVELIGETTDLLIKPGVLVKIANVEADVITIDPATINDPEGSPAAAVARVFADTNPRIRRWDMRKDKTQVTDSGEIKLDKSTWIELEDGVKVEFKTGEYVSGDYWLIPARTAEASIEWKWPPTDPQLPRGIHHYFAKLGICTLSFAGTTPQWTRTSDCRALFPPLSELISVFYAGGDGQEAIPATELSATLKVGVANGRWPLVQEEVTFEITSGGGKLLPNGVTKIAVKTNPTGIAECRWQLGPEAVPGQKQVVVATYTRNLAEQVHLPITFTAKQIPATMFYVSGDGQEAAPGDALNYPLKVGVAYEDVPVPDGTRVEFKILSGGGSFTGGTSPQATVVQTVGGVAQCQPWQIGSAVPQEVAATLLDINGNPRNNVKVVFAATPVRKSQSKGKCSYTVGKEGDFSTLEEAFEKLKDKKNVCLCLMAPVDDKEHEVRELKVKSKETIKITGCGATLKLAGQRFELEADKIMLHGINFSIVDVIKSQFTLKADEVDVNYCNFNSLLPPEANFSPLKVTITRNLRTETMASLNWKDNRMMAHYALVLESGVDGWIEDSIIEGALLLQFGQDFKPLTWNGQDKEKIRDAVKEGRLNGTGVLRLRGNTIGNVLTNGAGIMNLKPQTCYRNLFVAENVFRNKDNSFIGIYVDFVNNQFPENVDAVVAFVMGLQTAFTGNIADLSAGPIEAVYIEEVGITIPMNLVKIN